MRRRLTYALTAALLSVVLAAGVAQAQVKLVWTWCCGQDSRKVLFEELAREYSEQTPGVEVEAIYPGGNYAAVIATWIAGGTQVDVMWTGQNMWAFPFDPLDDLVRMEPNIGAVHPTMLQFGEWLGKQIVIPYGANTHTIAYNKGLFDRAGLAYPTADWTWDEAIAMAFALTRDTDGDGNPEQAGIWPYGPAVIASYLNYGGGSYSADGRTLNISNPGAVAGMQTYVDVTQKLGIAPVDHTKVNWASGNLAMQQIGIFNVPAMRVEGIDWDVVPLPGLTVEGERRVSAFVSMEAWGVNPYSPHRKEAWDFVRWLFTPEVMAQIGASGVVIPTSAYGHEAFLNQAPPPANLAAFIESFAYGHQQVGAHPAGSEIWSAIATNSLYSQMITGNADPGVVLPELERIGQAILDQYWASQQ